MIPQRSNLSPVRELFDELTGVLGLMYNKGIKSRRYHKKFLTLMNKEHRQERKRNFALADEEIRDKISSMGYIVEKQDRVLK